MKLLIEAGATKTEFVLLSNHSTTKGHTKGINPSTHPDSVSYINEIAKNYNQEVLEVFYYGAGLRPSTFDLIEKKLIKQFPNAKNFSIKNDLEAAIIATSEKEQSIIGILGTGSNFALCQNEKSLKKIPSPGFVFDDYGSGYAIGKLILEHYIYKKMSLEDAKLFDNTFPDDKEHLIKNIYSAIAVNQKVASYTPFLNKSSTDFRKKILQICFEEMLVKRIKHLEESNQYKLNFVGSIAFYFQKELRSVCQQHGYQVGAIASSSMDGLIKYHNYNE